MKPIYITLCKPFEKLSAEASRFWGNPALPSADDYPFYVDSNGDEMAYTFICQINLSELPPSPLPQKGLLLFFGKIGHYLGRFGEDYVGGTLGDSEAVKVIYLPDTEGLEEIVLLDGDDKPLSPEEREIKFQRGEDDTAMFAEPTHREWADWDAPYEGWEILLQVDSMDGMDFHLNFMDWGVLDFLISPEDLRNANFDNVRGIILST